MGKLSKCATCNAIFEDGKGWISDHYEMCANNIHGWSFTMPIENLNKGKGKGKGKGK